jgi:hypothetical protein
MAPDALANTQAQTLFSQNKKKKETKREHKKKKKNTNGKMQQLCRPNFLTMTIIH